MSILLGHTVLLPYTSFPYSSYLRLLFSARPSQEIFIISYPPSFKLSLISSLPFPYYFLSFRGMVGPILPTRNPPSPSYLSLRTPAPAHSVEATEVYTHAALYLGSHTLTYSALLLSLEVDICSSIHNTPHI